MTAVQIGGKALQTLMRHKSYTTTPRYIDMRPALQDVTALYTIPTLRERKAK